MGTCQRRLIRHAQDGCLPHLLDDVEIRPWVDEIAFVLVGSVATGLCADDSDVDIALVCDAQTYDHLSPGKAWGSGRPTEATVGGVRLHYYGIALDEIAAKVEAHDDACFYVYAQTIILRDSQTGHGQRLGALMDRASQLRGGRAEGKLDMLLRRSRALEAMLGGDDRDPITVGRGALEVLTLMLKVAALLDDVPFDPRKRLFATALAGATGEQLRRHFGNLSGQLGLLGDLANHSNDGDRFIEGVNTVVQLLGQTAEGQGLRVGLDRPDHRHAER